MISARRAQLSLFFLLTFFSGASLFAAPTDLKLLLDSDNSLSTGCRVITSLGNVDGIDAIYTTTYDTGADGNLVVTGITAQTCATKGTVNFTAPVQIDPGGWAVGTKSNGTLVAETRIPVSALPNGIHANMRWAFLGVTGTNQDTIINNADGHTILFPAPMTSHHRIVGIGPPTRTITLDGKDGDWAGLSPLATGLASTGGPSLRFLGGVTGFATENAIFFYFSIQSNSNAPTANDDGWQVLRGTSINISAPGVLANDFDPNHKPLTAILISGPEHGTLTLNADGSFAYHNDGSNAPHDGFRYKANNGSADSNTGRVSFDIIDNRPPVAADDLYNVTHGGTLNVPPPGVLINDHDPDGDPIVSQIVTPPGHGTVTLNNDGSFTYTHNGSNTTSDQFGYHDLDAFSASNIATVTLTVGPDAPPVANNDSYTVAEGGTLTAAGLPSAQSLFANDTDPDSPKTLFTATITQQPAHGSLTLNSGGGNGGFTYIHDGSETLSDVFKYTVSDGIMSSNVATVTITVTPVNDAPVNSVPGAQTLLEDGTLVFSIGNANAITVSDADGGASVEQITLTATNGTLTLGSTAGISITGGANGSATVTFQGTLAAMNAAMNGTTYAPTANYFGPAQVTITSNDLGNSGAGGPQSATSNIGITVTPVNDVPSFTSGGAVTVLEDSGAHSAAWATGISAGPANESGQAVNFIISNNSNPGLFSALPAVSPTGVLTFTPAANANGSAIITIAIHDNGGTANGGVDTSATQTFNINVTPVNDAPSFTKGADESVAEDSGAHTVNGWATAISAGPPDETGQTLIFFVGNNNNSLFSIQPGIDASGNLTYTLAANASGTAIVNVQLQDSGGIANGGVDTSATQTFNIVVNGVNDAPVNSVPGAQSTAEDTPLTFSAANSNAITVSDVDANGGTEKVTLSAANGTVTLGTTAGITITGGANNSASVTFTGTIAQLNTAMNGMSFTPTPNYNGSASVSITTDDQGNSGSGGPLTDTDSVTITVTAVNDAPVNSVPGTQTTNEDTSLVFSSGNSNALSISDIDAGGATVQVQLSVTNGTVTLGGTTNLSITGGANGTSTVTVQGTIADINTGLNGTTYAPTANFNGAAQLTITTSDLGNTGSGGAQTDTDSVTINVTAVNDAPVITRPATASTNEDVALTFNGGNTISIADVDAGGGSITVTLGVSNGVLTLSGTTGLTVSGNGTNSITASGTLANVNNALNGMTYLSSQDFNGSDTLNVGVNDNGNTGTGGPLTDSKSVAITINPVNDAPVAVADSYSVNEDNPLTVNAASGVLANDTDVDTPHGSLTAVLNVGPANASAFTLNADGSFTYTPNANFNGSDPFTYHAFDGALGSNIVTVTITVNAVNDAPVITRPANITANEDQAFTFSGTISISDVDAGAGSETLTLGVTNGTLTLSGTSGLTVSGNGTNSITASGTLANLNAALNGMQYLGSSNYNGPDTLNIGINDNGNTGTGGPLTDAKSTSITVTAVNDPPVNGIPGAQSINEDTSLTFSSGNGNAITVSDVDAGGGNLQVTLTTTAGTITLGGTTGLTVTGNGTGTVQATGTIAALNTGLNGTVFTPTANLNGAQTIGMTTSDLGNTGSGGAQTDTDTININIGGVNDPPVNSMPAPPTVNQDTPLTMSGAGAIQISDVDAGSNPVQVALVATNGTMTLNGIAGLSFTLGDGTTDASMTFTGTISAINTSLNGMQFNPSPGFFGAASIQITTNDQGNTGSGGALQDQDTLTITVIQVNQPPVNSVPGAQTINEDTSRTFSSGNGNLISISDPDAGGATVRVSLSVSNGTLTLSGTTGLVFGSGANGTASMTFDGTIANINTALNGLVYAPTANFNGSDTLTIITNDLGNTGPGGAMTDTDTVTINITSVDDAPVAVNDSYSVNEGATLTISLASLPRFPVVDQSLTSGGRRHIVAPPSNGSPNTPVPTALGFGVLHNDTDIDTAHNLLTAVLGTGPLHASSFTLNSDGTFTYVHDGSETTTDSFTYQAFDGTLFSNIATATITINPVNDPPTFTSPNTASVPENTTAVMTVTTTDPDGGAPTYSVTGGADLAKFSIVAGTGALSFITPPNFEVPTDSNADNVYVVQVTANDGAGGITNQTISVTVTNVDEAPNFTSSATPSVPENTTAVVTVNAVDPEGATVTYAKTGGADAAKFSLDTNTGALAFLSAPNFEAPTDAGANNVYDVQVTATDQTAHSTVQNIAVTVTDVNEAPTITSTNTASVPENTTAVKTVTATDPDTTPAFNTLTYSIVGGADQLKFAIGSSSGVLTFVSAPNFEVPTDANADNDYIVQVQVTDGANPVTQTITVTVTNVNEAPTANADSYTALANTTMKIGAGVTLPGTTVASTGDVATTPVLTGVIGNDTDPDSIASGFANLSVSTYTGNAGSVAAGTSTTTTHGTLTVASDGSILYTPAAGYTGTDSFTYNLTDGTNTVGGTVNLTVTGPRIWYLKDNTTTAGTAGTSADPFKTVATLNGTTFAANDIIYIMTGTLTGGTRLAVPAPITLNQNNMKIWGQGVALSLTVNTNLLNLISAGTAPNIGVVGVAGNTVAVTNATTTEVKGLDIQAGAVGIAASSTAAGSVGATIANTTISNTTGIGISLAAGGSAAASIDVQGINITSTGNGFDATRTAGTMGIVFSNNTISSGANGVNIVGGAIASSTITAFANNSISGNTVGSGILISNATFDGTAGGAYQPVSGGTTVIGSAGNGVGAAGMVLTTVAGDLSFTDLDIVTSNGAGLAASSAVAFTTDAAGTGFQISVGAGVATIDATGGPAADLSTVTASLPFVTIKSANSASTGVSLVTVPGTFTAGAGSTITNATGTDFNISGSNATVTYDGTITDSTSSLVTITNITGGTKTFTGAISDSGSGTGQGISFTNGANTGGTVNFTGQLTLSTGSNPAFTATVSGLSSGGTVSASNTNSTIVTTTGTAINVNGATIGAANLKFKSVSAGTAGSGPTNGIILNNTGASGGLIISGTGSAGSGGTIQKTGTAGISLTSVGGSVSLTNMVVKTSTHDGIRGTTVNNFTLASCSVTSNGTVSADNGVHITDASGSVSMTNDSVTSSFGDNVDFDSTVSSAAVITTFTVTGGAYSSSTNGAGFLVQLKNNAVIQTGSFTGVTLNANATYAIDLVTNDNSTIGNGSGAPATGTFTISGNTITNDGGVGVSFADGGGSGAANMYVRFLSNTMTFTKSHAINVVSGAGTTGGTLKVLIDSNIVGTAGTPDSGSKLGEGIQVTQQGRTIGTVTITNNTIRALDNGAGEFGNRCIDVQTLGPAPANGGAVPFDVKISGNNVDSQYAGTFPQAAIYLGVDDQAGTPTTMHAEVHGNTVPAVAGCEGNNCTASSGMIFYDKVTSPSTGTLFNFSGAGGGNNVSLEIANNNTGTSGKTCAVDLVNLTLTATAVNVVP